jgi:hypothetical protein
MIGRRILTDMNYDNTSLPEEVQKYLAEIYNDEELRDVFYDCDIEIYDEDWIKDIEEDDAWLEELMGPGESSYSNLKPFGRDGTGALWVVIDDRMIGYIGTEGQCGIVARNIHEFMNIASVWGGYLCDYWDEDILASRDAFYDTMNNPERLEQYENIERNRRVFEGFIKRHGFTKEIYEMAVGGITVEPLFIVKATTDEYVDSESLISPLDGQNKLEDLIKRLK